MSTNKQTAGITALAAGGLGSAFAVASCCALPIIFASLGLGFFWFAPLGSAAMPYDGPLTALAVAGLLLSVVFVVRASRTCAPGDLCSKPWFRRTIIGVALAGALLLVLSWIIK
jgi:mercuric ion transport protein